MLEPRRIAARAAAERMAQTLGERVGETVGLRVRFGSKVSRKTRIEIVTEGIFTRLILDDPMLDGIAAVLFDEFHERSLDADLGLALARDAQQGLREDLKLLVMSATIDGARVAGLLGGAPVIESEGRAFAVETRYAGRDTARRSSRKSPTPSRARCAPIPARCWRSCPAPPKSAAPRRSSKAAPIRRPMWSRSTARCPARSRIAPSSPPPPGRRKIVLATSIAETSITIEGVRIVVDCGLARVPRYEPDVGVTRLETVRVSRAAADQRRGRAGRTEPGICYRLWDEPQTAALEALRAAGNPRRRSFVLRARPRRLGRAAGETRLPRSAAARGARPRRNALLAELGAIDADGRITDEGRHLRRLPLPPRLARMVVDAAAAGEALQAAEIAALIGERGLGGDDVDLRERLNALHRDRSPPRPRRPRHGGALGGDCEVESRACAPRRASGRRETSASARCSRSPIPNASPKTAAAARARFCWPTAAAPMSIAPRRSRASRFSPSPN